MLTSKPKSKARSSRKMKETENHAIKDHTERIPSLQGTNSVDSSSKVDEEKGRNNQYEVHAVGLMYGSDIHKTSEELMLSQKLKVTTFGAYQEVSKTPRCSGTQL